MSTWYVVLFALIYINSECKIVNQFIHSKAYNDHISDVHNNLLNVQHHKPFTHATRLVNLSNDEYDDEHEHEKDDVHDKEVTHEEEDDHEEDDEASHEEDATHEDEEASHEDEDDDESPSSDVKDKSKLTERPNNNDKNKSKSGIESKEENHHKPHVCGQGERDILLYQQPDYSIALMGLIDKGVFKLFAGNVIVKEISMWDVISPIEMVNSKCFSIRRSTQLPVVLCAGGIDSRNRWVNALESSRLCLTTKVKFYLPNSIDNDFVEPEDPPPSGINVFVAESQFGKPEIVINGQTLDQIKKAEMESILTNDQYENTSWNNTQMPEYQNDRIGEEFAESEAEAELKREKSPESGHSRFF